MANQNELIRALKMIPPKWALGIIGLLIGYWLLQPVANRTFGWKLPTLVAIVNNDYSSTEAAKPPATKETAKKDTEKKDIENKEAVSKESVSKDTTENKTANKKASKTATPDNSSPANRPEAGSASKATVAAKSTKTDPSLSSSETAGSKSSSKPVSNSATKSDVGQNTSSIKPANTKPTTPSASIEASNEPPTYGYLKSIGRERYESPEGLVYAPGSEEGHRIKHIARHTQDIPNRPGSHGVFEGDMAQFLETIDKGYRLALSKAKGTKTRDEDGLTVMEVTFDKKIGFVGGSDGRRKGTPSTKRLRIVVNGDRLITAFPF